MRRLLYSIICTTALLACRPASAAPGALTRTAFAGRLAGVAGDSLTATAIEVRYGPGGYSTPHSHPCPVVGYVLEGSLRFQVRGAEERVYRAGQAFYEAANSAHLVSANASNADPVRFLAVFVCDHSEPLSRPVSAAGPEVQP